MPENILYVLEKFHLALVGVATSTAGLRERLADAYMSNFVQLNAREATSPVARNCGRME
jgi:hypothetical protein